MANFWKAKEWGATRGLKKISKGAFLGSPPFVELSVCVQTVNTDASQRLHRQTQSSVHTKSRWQAHKTPPETPDNEADSGGRAVFSCRCAAAEWTNLRDLRPDTREGNNVKKKADRKTDWNVTSTLDDELISDSNRVFLSRWRPRRLWHFALSFPSIKAKLLLHNASEILRLSPVLHHITFCVEATQPSSRVQRETVGIKPHFPTNGCNSAAFGILYK